MKVNIGKWDSVIRVSLAAVLFMLLYVATLTMTTSIILGMVAVVLLVTGLVGTCPLYTALGIQTASRNTADS